MRTRFGSFLWYDIIFFGLAAAVVYPDKVLHWICECTGRAFGGLYVVLIEVVAIALMVGAMVLLKPAYPQLHWGDPLMFVGSLAALRGIIWFITDLAGFRD